MEFGDASPVRALLKQHACRVTAVLMEAFEGVV